MQSTALTDKAQTTFKRVAQHFAQKERFFRNMVVVPTNDARYTIVFRQDGNSADRLVLELAVQACVACPNMATDSEGTQFFTDTWTCLIRADEDSGEGTVIEPTRCQHAIGRTSPRALYEALMPLRDFVSDNAARRLYGVRKKYQDRGEESLFEIGERFSMRNALINVPASALSDTDAATLSTWTLIGIVIGSVLLAIAVAVGTVFAARAIVQKSKHRTNSVNVQTSLDV